MFAGQAGTAAAGLLGVKILTYVLNPAEYGRLALANTIVALIGVNLFGPIGQGVMRFWAISKDRETLEEFYLISNRYTKLAFYIVLLLSFVSAVILGVTKDIDWAILFTLSVMVGGITGWLSLRISIFTAVRQRRRVALFNSASAFFRPVIAAFVVLLIASNASWAMVGYLVAALLMMLMAEPLYSLTVSQTSGSSLVEKKSVPLFQGLGKEIITFSAPFFVWTLFSWAHMSCDRWALQAYHGADVVGAFAVVSLLAVYPLTFGAGFLSTLFTPIAFQRAGDLTSFHSTRSANKLLIGMSATYTVGATILIVLFGLLHHPLVLMISNASFAEFSYFLPGLTAAWALFHFGQALSSFGMLANKPHKYILPKLISGILAVISTFYLSATIGPIGVVWGLAAAGFVYAVWCFIIAVKLGRRTGVKKEAILNAT